MVRIVLLFTAIGLACTYFFTAEGRSVNNGLVCQYLAEDLSLLFQKHESKFRSLLPEKFPEERFKFLSAGLAKSGSEARSDLICDTSLLAKFKNSPFYEVRMTLFPIYPSSLITLARIAQTQVETKHFINQLKGFKSEIIKENDRFDNFLQDCTRMKSFAEQISLLKSHLKIEKRARNPASNRNLKMTEYNMNKNISKQVSFAQKQLADNEKLFHYKWKIYFKLDSGKSICQY